MSKLIVEVSTIDEILVHPNADKLEIARVKGWTCVVGKNQFKQGDKCVYIPIDAVLPEELVKIVFANSKIVPAKGRIKTIRIRGAISQGLCTALPLCRLPFDLPIGTDVADRLGITKYEPPENPHVAAAFGNKKGRKVKVNNNPEFHEYTDIQNIKHYPELFANGEIVSVTEKIHGTSFRAGWFKYNANTWWKKLKRFLRLTPECEFCYGSHHVQLQTKEVYKGYYDQAIGNVYAEIAHQYGITWRLQYGEAVYGEIYGHGIQKNYHYGCKENQRLFVAFDAQVDGRWLDVDEFFRFCWLRGIPTVKEIYRGPYFYGAIKELASSKRSIMHPEQETMEGVVVKPLLEEQTHMGRKILKVINDDYLLCKTTEWH